VIRRLTIPWPDERPFRARDGRAIRLLAVSDEREPALEAEQNRSAIEPVDAVIGCGDLDPKWLAFLADAFRAPLVFVRGNHDHGGDWDVRLPVVPQPLGSGTTSELVGLTVAGLEWPGAGSAHNQRRPDIAWRDAAGLLRRRLAHRLTTIPSRRGEPILVISHAAPEGAGDAPDLYHRGFPAYRRLLDWLRPPVWLHGHTTTAAVDSLVVRSGATTLVNVTGAVLVELVPPDIGA
jgi:Icc-related predicted phosphoesterase